MVTILLAVYNGEKYLKAQIESILSQSFKDFKIIIRDDGSTDKSVDIINYYLTHDEEREKKAKCAQKITQENFTSRIVAKKFDELIEEIKNENMFVINK